MSKLKFWVVCADYATGPHGTREIAERLAGQIKAEGKCPHKHEVKESVTRPIPSGEWAREYYAGRD